uniref:Secreted protein n=1 Tax=Rodentolepis nana TaxID=102285 RepID=A0A0R3TIS9_RODNA
LSMFLLLISADLLSQPPTHIVIRCVHLSLLAVTTFRVQDSLNRTYFILLFLQFLVLFWELGFAGMTIHPVRKIMKAVGFQSEFVSHQRRPTQILVDSELFPLRLRSVRT